MKFDNIKSEWKLNNFILIGNNRKKTIYEGIVPANGSFIN